MKKVDVDIFHETSNLAVIRMPGRQFPGILIQGDSLFAIYTLVSKLRNLLSESELFELATEIEAPLIERLKIYEDALEAHGMSLPYEKI